MLVKLFWFGTVLGCTWEFAFDVLGDDFCSIKVPELLLIPGTRGIAHSLGDGILFSIGVWLARDLCKGPHFAKYNLKEFMIMFTWGQLQEIAVDLTGNGWIWHYHPNHWANFTMFEWEGISYTATPQIVWVFASILFYAGTIYIAKNHEKKD